MKVCSSIGVWIGLDIKECIRVQCEEPTWGVHVTHQPKMKYYLAGDNITYSCASGKKIINFIASYTFGQIELHQLTIMFTHSYVQGGLQRWYRYLLTKIFEQ